MAPGTDADADATDADRDAAGPSEHPGVDPRVSAGVEHLQSAAREMIGAARAFLDVIEELVEDEDKVADVFSAVGEATRAAARAARQGAASARGADAPGSAPGVQRIDVDGV